MIILSILMFSFLLAGCSESVQAEYTSFPLFRTELDGNEIQCENGSIAFDGNGSGILILGEEECVFSYNDDAIYINSITAPYEIEDNSVILTMGETGLEYFFGSGTDVIEESTPKTPFQRQWEGNWTGRMYFSVCSGKWEEYEGRSIQLSGSLEIDDANTGSLLLFCDAFSDQYPVFTSEIEFGEVQDHNCQGYVFGYPVTEGSVSIRRDMRVPSDINNTEFVDPHEYEWFIEEPEKEPETPVDVISFIGNCRDDSDAFNYEITLKKEP